MKRLIEDDATDFERMLLGSIALDAPPEGAEAAVLDRLDGAPVVAIAEAKKKIRNSTWLFLVAAAIGAFAIMLSRQRHEEHVPIVREEPLPTPSALAASPTQAFDRSAAANALGQVNLDECQPLAGPSGAGHVEVMFEPAGNVRWVAVDPPFDDSDRGQCIAQKFYAVHVPPFQGAAVRVGKSFVLQ